MVIREIKDVTEKERMLKKKETISKVGSKSDRNDTIVKRIKGKYSFHAFSARIHLFSTM